MKIYHRRGGVNFLLYRFKNGYFQPSEKTQAYHVVLER